MTPFLRQQNVRVAIAFAMVYIFWGSTYLGIRIAVEEMAPFVMGAWRFLLGGGLMLAWCAWRGIPIGINRNNAWRLALIGVLLLTGGNMGVAYAEKYIPSGLASLIVAIVPIWVAVVEGLILRLDRLNLRGWLGLAVGFSGLGVLFWPKITSGSSLGNAQLVACVVLTLASLSWSIGSIASRHWKLGLGPLAATGWEMTVAGAMNLLLSIATGDLQKAHITGRGAAAVLYLMVFGSWVGLTAYIWLLDHVPTPKVATYAYVNPIVAIFLGWLIANEKIDAYIIAGSIFIIGGVALVTTAKIKAAAKSPAAVQPLPACEAEA